MAAMVATRRRGGVLAGIDHAVYDLSEPFHGHDALLIMHFKGRNRIHPVKGVKTGRAIGEDVGETNPDKTMEKLGYFVRG